MTTKPARKASNPHLGTDFDEFLREDGLYDEAQAIAVKRVLWPFIATCWDFRRSDGFSMTPLRRSLLAVRITSCC